MAEVDGATGDPTKLRARRTSLDLLHFALEGDWAIDRFQMQQLRRLLEEREHHLRSQPLPFWPGARRAAIVAMLTEIQGAREATEELDRLLAKTTDRRRGPGGLGDGPREPLH
jgi:hypothetical protein